MAPVNWEWEKGYFSPLSKANSFLRSSSTWQHNVYFANVFNKSNLFNISLTKNQKIRTYKTYVLIQKKCIPKPKRLRNTFFLFGSGIEILKALDRAPTLR